MSPSGRHSLGPLTQVCLGQKLAQSLPDPRRLVGRGTNEACWVQPSRVKELPQSRDRDLRRRLNEPLGVFKDLKERDLQWL